MIALMGRGWDAGTMERPGRQFHRETGLGDRSILIAEDEAMIALMLRLTLQDAGYAVVGTEATGQGTLAAVDQAAAEGQLPALLLLDISLRGGMDGVEVATALRQNHPGLRIVFMTGQADPATRARAEATRPDAYLVKPVAPEQLEAVLDRVLRGAAQGNGAYA
jgi:CheY-like chemotaxis protein